MFLAFLNEFDPDLKETFLEKLRVLWTHGSTGLEGNTLTLGETHAVLSQGLTISGNRSRTISRSSGTAAPSIWFTRFVRAGVPWPGSSRISPRCGRDSHRC